MPMRTNVDFLIDALDRERALVRTSRKRPDGRDETALQLSYSNEATNAIERTAGLYPELRDTLACIVLGALPVDLRSPRAIFLLRTVLGNAHAPASEVRSFVLRAYSGASEDLVDSGIDVRRLIINAADRLIDTSENPSRDVYQAVLRLLENPPPAVLARPEYQHAHRLHMATVAFVHPQADEQTRSQLLHKMADAIDALEAMYSAEPRVLNSPLDATFFASHLWHRHDALPLLNRLIGFSEADLHWDSMWALAYLAALMHGTLLFTPQQSDSQWVSKALYPLLKDPMDELFHQRAFAPERVYTTITNRLREGGYDVYWQFVKNILETEDLSRYLLCDLVAGYMRRFPRSVRKMARVAAQQMTSDESVKKFATLVAGGTDFEHKAILKMLPPRAHEALTTELRAKYREIGSKNTALRNTVAERLLASVYHLLPLTVRAMCAGGESPSAVWNALQTALGQPDRVLRAKPEQRARFQRWLDNARHEDLITRLCAPPDEI